MIIICCVPAQRTDCCESGVDGKCAVGMRGEQAPAKDGIAGAHVRSFLCALPHVRRYQGQPGE